jgi:zinc transport system substrate-binding protein
MSVMLKKLMILLLFLLVSCSGEKQTEDKIKVSVSIAPLANITELIGGNKVDIQLIVPPGVNVHSFELKPSDIKIIADSKLYFKVGGTFQLDNILLDKISIDENKFKVIDCSEGIVIVDNNPHYWLGPEEIKIAAHNIYNALANETPEFEKYFDQNLQKFTSIVDSLDIEFTKELMVKKHKIIMVYHPAWIYFTNHYHLQQITIEVEGKSPKARDLANSITLAKKNNIKILFVDPHFDPASAITISNSLGIKIEYLNPLPTQYLSNLIEVGHKIINSLD